MEYWPAEQVLQPPTMSNVLLNGWLNLSGVFELIGVL